MPLITCYSIEVNNKEPVMNLSEVNTPAELIEQNNTAIEPNTSQLDALVEQLTLEEAYAHVMSVINKLGCYHQSVMDELKESNDLDKLVVWAQDEQKLHTMWDMMNEVANNE